MLLLALVLILLVLVYIVRVSNNNDVLEKNTKTEEDLATIKENKKKIKTSKLSIGIILASIAILIAMLICDFTSIDAAIIDYISTEFYQEQPFDRMYYFIPCYIFIAINIYNEVKIGEFLFNYYKVQEEEMEININKEKLMGLLYKKKTTTEGTPEITSFKEGQETPSTEPTAQTTENTQKPEN